MKVVKLESPQGDAYDKFLKQSSETGLFCSNKYRLILKDFLQAEDHYFLLLNDSGKITAALPSFMKENKVSGNVLNSLPFYGSNGGIISESAGHGDKKILLDAFYKYAEDNNCISSVIVTSPFEKDNEFYESNSAYNYKDERIGQITLLPEVGDTEEALMSMIHRKTRNHVRKSMKSDLEVSDIYSDEAFDFLCSVHTENIESLGGKAKPRSFFETVRKYLEYGTDYRIYTCTHNKSLVSALLIIYFNRTAEYFTPVIKKEFRHLQPLSLLIFRAMADAARGGFRYWNWGGTWVTQDGVYLFKRGWGTTDMRYYYYIKLFNNKAIQFTGEDLLEQYPYFYVVPFDVLNK